MKYYFLLKFIHVLLAVSSLGLSIAQYHYLYRSYKSQNQAIMVYALRFSILVVAICMACLILVPLTGIALVDHLPRLNWSVRWVQVALIASMAAFILLIIVEYMLVYCCYRGMTSLRWRCVTILTILFWICNVLIIRDAVFKQTFF